MLGVGENVNLSSPTGINILPGEVPQMLHRDDGKVKHANNTLEKKKETNCSKLVARTLFPLTFPPP